MSRLLNEGRGINPGDTGDHWGISSSPHTLNEGRGINPGDTLGEECGRYTGTRV